MFQEGIVVREYSAIELFIRENAQTMSDADMAKEMNITGSYIRWKRHRMGIWTKFDITSSDEESGIQTRKKDKAYPTHY